MRQHELTEAAGLLNIQLHAGIIRARKAEEALIGSEKLVSAGRMAAALVHAINKPLAAVMNLFLLARTTVDIPVPVNRRYA